MIALSVPAVVGLAVAALVVIVLLAALRSMVNIVQQGTVGVVKRASAATTYVTIDGGMSDNPRPAMYGARYAALLANRADEPVQPAARSGLGLAAGHPAGAGAEGDVGERGEVTEALDDVACLDQRVSSLGLSAVIRTSVATAISASTTADAYAPTSSNDW